MRPIRSLVFVFERVTGTCREDLRGMQALFTSPPFAKVARRPFSAIVDEHLANHYEIERTSYDTGIRHGNLTICGCQRLAAMAGAAAQRHFTGNRPAQGMAEGWTGAAVESSGDRLRLLDACRGWGAALPAGQRRAGR